MIIFEELFTLIGGGRGSEPILKKNGYRVFQKPGAMAGKIVTDPKTGVRTQTFKEGVFEIGVTKGGVIDHRFFRPRN